MTRRGAHALAGRQIFNIWGFLRTTWINDFLGYPARGEAWYPGDSAALGF